MACFGTLHPSSKSANILKAALRSRRISKALQLFKGGLVFDAVHAPENVLLPGECR